eukprot:7391907-Prymnesium_polylepis.1
MLGVFANKGARLNADSVAAGGARWRSERRRNPLQPCASYLFAVHGRVRMLLLGCASAKREHARPAALRLLTVADCDARELAALSVRQHLVALGERASCVLDCSSFIEIGTPIHQKIVDKRSPSLTNVPALDAVPMQRGTAEL